WAIWPPAVLEPTNCASPPRPDHEEETCSMAHVELCVIAFHGEPPLRLQGVGKVIGCCFVQFCRHPVKSAWRRKGRPRTACCIACSRSIAILAAGVACA